MPPQPPKAELHNRIWLVLLAVGLPFLMTFLLGSDASWDLRNYHLYNPHAWLTGRDSIDVAAAQLQTWHNPLLDVPLYLITCSAVSNWWASAWLTLPTVFTLLMLFRLQGALSQGRPSRMSRAVLALLAVTGAATGSTLGLSSNDAFVGASIMGCLALLASPSEGPFTRHRWLFAGLLAGAITGLKLTAIFYCVGLAAAALAVGPWQQRLRRLAALTVGGAIGFVSTYGFWGWKLFRNFGNPFFPYYNNVFGSGQAQPLDWADARFRSNSIADALATPFQLLVRSTHYSEIALSDPRLLLGLIGLAMLWLVHRRSAGQSRNRFLELLVFMIVSWLLWSLQYGIYRYAIVLELLGCLAFVLLLGLLPRARDVALLVGLLIVSADTKRPNWGHVPFAATTVQFAGGQIPADSLVVIASQEPLAYASLGLPTTVPMIAVWNNLMAPGRCMGLQASAKSRVLAHSGPIWIIESRQVAEPEGRLLVSQYVGLEVSGPCKRMDSTIGDAHLCPLRRVREAATGC